MGRKHSRTLAAVFAEPTRANLAWLDAVSLLESLGAIVRPAGGSVFHIALNGVVITLHRPHPGNELSKGRVRALKEFLTEAGISP